jgi:FMN phosphatase YigB (HAD superfamily)
MPLTLEQYAADYLPPKGLPWPIPPAPVIIKAKPSLHKHPIKCVLWSCYGTLLNILQGELLFEHPQRFVTDNALDKTIKEFNMWNSMSRKPGAPAEYMYELVKKALTMLQMTGTGGEKHPDVLAEKVWDDIVKKLQQKDYKFDATLYGSYDEFVKKIAYFYHASFQGTAAYPGAVDAVRLLADAGVVNGLLTDGQCFTIAQMHKAFRDVDPSFEVNAFFPSPLRVISCEKKAKKPSDTLFKAAVDAIAARGWKPSQVLHIGSNLMRDLVPAKKHGFLTGLYAGDKSSCVATKDQIRDPAYMPDVLLTELPQVLEVLA